MNDRKFTRTMNVTRLKLKEVLWDDGESITKDLPDLVIYGKISPEIVEEKIRHLYGLATILKISTKTTQNQYEMDLQTFIENATCVEERELL